MRHHIAVIIENIIDNQIDNIHHNMTDNTVIISNIDNLYFSVPNSWWDNDLQNFRTFDINELPLQSVLTDLRFNNVENITLYSLLNKLKDCDFTSSVIHFIYIVGFKKINQIEDIQTTINVVNGKQIRFKFICASNADAVKDYLISRGDFPCYLSHPTSSSLYMLGDHAAVKPILKGADIFNNFTPEEKLVSKADFVKLTRLPPKYYAYYVNDYFVTYNYL